MSETEQSEEPKKERRIERKIEIAAPIEDVWPDHLEVQAWLSAFSLPTSQVEDFGKKSQLRLQEIF